MLPGTLLSSAGTYLDAFHAVNRYGRRYQRADPEAETFQVLEIEIVGVQGACLSLAHGLEWRTNRTIAHPESYDLVIIAGCEAADDGSITADPELAAWLRAQYEAGAIVAASGSAVLALAETGLLNGRTASVPWWSRDVMAHRYPGVKVDKLATATEDGRLHCAAYPQDDQTLAIHLVRLASTASLAEWIARDIGLGASNLLDPTPTQIQDALQFRNSLVERCRYILKGRMSQPVCIAALASELGVSTRTLDRRFRAATGMSPLVYLQQERIAVAQRMLDRSDHPIERIVNLVGYADPAAFAKLFRRETGLTPHEWRRRGRNQTFVVTNVSHPLAE